MRVGELAALAVGDFEDDGDVGFLKVRVGKSAKFRRVPLSSRLRREVGRYINRFRPDTDGEHLLVRTDGQSVHLLGPNSFFDECFEAFVWGQATVDQGAEESFHLS